MAQSLQTEFVVGKIISGIAFLISEDFRVIEIPTFLVPEGTKEGSTVFLNVTKKAKDEERRKLSFLALQEEIYDQLGKIPNNLETMLKYKSHNTALIEWNLKKLEGTKIISTSVEYDNKERSISPNSSFVLLTDLQPSQEFLVTIVFLTRIGKITSQINIETQPADDLKYLNVSFDGFEKREVEILTLLLKGMGGKSSQAVTLETTHIIARDSSGKKCELAKKHKIPIVSEKWLKDCSEKSCYLPIRNYLIL